MPRVKKSTGKDAQRTPTMSGGGNKSTMYIRHTNGTITVHHSDPEVVDEISVERLFPPLFSMDSPATIKSKKSHLKSFLIYLSQHEVQLELENGRLMITCCGPTRRGDSLFSPHLQVHRTVPDDLGFRGFSCRRQ